MCPAIYYFKGTLKRHLSDKSKRANGSIQKMQSFSKEFQRSSKIEASGVQNGKRKL